MTDLLEKFENGILTLTINRPKSRNAMTLELMEDMRTAIGKAGKSPDVRCLVITGTGQAFCVGADANQIPTDPSKTPSREERIRDLRVNAKLSELLHTIPKPTIAVMPGMAAGGGLSIALACDMRFCLNTATLSTAFTRIGGSGDFGVSYFLPQLVGMAKARELLFTSKRITGQQAYDMGLVTQIATADTFEEEAKAFVKDIASLPTMALGYIKQNLVATQSMSLEALLDLETENMVLAMETEDHKEAVKAFLSKTTPKFTGR